MAEAVSWLAHVAFPAKDGFGRLLRRYFLFSHHVMAHERIDTRSADDFSKTVYLVAASTKCGKTSRWSHPQSEEMVYRRETPWQYVGCLAMSHPTVVTYSHAMPEHSRSRCQRQTALGFRLHFERGLLDHRMRIGSQQESSEHGSP